MLKRYCKERREKGFTLIELMAVLVIVGLLATFVGMNVAKRVEEAKVKTTTVQINQLSANLEAFKMDNGFYPSTEQGVDALVSEPTFGRIPKHYPAGGYLNKKVIPKDPWDNPYNYREPGTHNPDSFDLFSNGPDGQEGTEDDITNWSEE